MKTRQNSILDSRKFFILAAIGAMFFMIWAYVYRPETDLCSHLSYLIEQSESDFVDIQQAESLDFRGYDTSFMLPNAKTCVIFEDVEKLSYQCTWEFPLADIQAETTFESLSEEVRACIGHIAVEQLDQPVNHPDIYRSSYFQLPQGQLSISLKNKSELSSTLVSIRIDGSTHRQ